MRSCGSDMADRLRVSSSEDEEAVVELSWLVSALTVVSALAPPLLPPEAAARRSFIEARSARSAVVSSGAWP